MQFPIKFPRLRGIQSRLCRAITFLIAIIFGLQIDLIAAAGCTSGRMEGDRREAVVEDSLPRKCAVYSGKMLRIFGGRQVAAPTKRKRKIALSFVNCISNRLC